MSLFRTTVGAITGALTLCALASPASAHPLVDEGRELMQLAEFDQALDAFARAEASDDLTQEELIDLLDARAMCYLATGDEAAMDRDLVALVSLDLTHEFGPEAPPELSDALADVAATSTGGLVVEAHARPVPGGVEVEASVHNDPANLARSTVLWVRPRDGTWRRAAETLVTLPLGGTLDYYAELFGPGGAPLAQHGSRETPLTSGAALGGGAAPIRQDEEGAASARGSGSYSAAWSLIGGGVAALLLFGGDAGGGASGTQPNAPIVVGF